jgi:hypothetical protein
LRYAFVGTLHANAIDKIRMEGGVKRTDTLVQVHDQQKIEITNYKQEGQMRK